MMQYIHKAISWSNRLSPRTRKIILIALWCAAPIEMLIITGIWKGVKRLEFKVKTKQPLEKSVSHD